MILQGKTCWDCHKEKAEIEFYKCVRSLDNRQSRCKECFKLYRKSKKYKKSKKAYDASEKGKIVRRKYEESEKGKIKFKKYSLSIKGRYCIAKMRKSDKFKLSTKKYRSSIKGKSKLANQSAKRRAAKLKATPNWLSKNHIIEIEMYYQRAAYLTEVTGIKWHVDHIIPLQGKIVSGLHVPWNLRVIPEKENESKGNKIL